MDAADYLNPGLSAPRLLWLRRTWWCISMMSRGKNGTSSKPRLLTQQVRPHISFEQWLLPQTLPDWLSAKVTTSFLCTGTPDNTVRLVTVHIESIRTCMPLATLILHKMGVPLGCVSRQIHH